MAPVPLSVSAIMDGGLIDHCVRCICVCPHRFVIDGNKTILQREEPDQKVEEVTFEANEVYAIDICFSSGEGKVHHDHCFHPHCF